MLITSTTDTLDVSRAQLLSASPFFDAVRYAQRTDIPAGMDPALHYVTRGWQSGLEPLTGVETEFMWPYFSSIGISGPPAVAWLEFAVLGLPLPASYAEAARLAEQVRHSSLFDLRYYRRFVPAALDPALHYVLAGEPVGLRPSTGFDPHYYRRTNPDRLPYMKGRLALLDYEHVGRAEHRKPFSPADCLVFDPLRRDQRPVVLVICHEASRTGAPILGWNLIKALGPDCQVVSMLMRGGELEPEFRSTAAASISNLGGVHWHPFEMRRIADRIVREYRPLYAIANSIETHAIVPALAQAGVPVVALVHEFAAYTRPRSKFTDLFDWASAVVFPAQMVAQSSYRNYAGLSSREGIHVFAQGQSEIPHAAQSRDKKHEKPIQLRPKGWEDAIVILGAGTVQLRKGVEVFIATAAAARRMRPDLKLLFVWVGHGFNPELDLAYSVYINEQIERSDLGDSLIMMDAVEDIESVYRQSDFFLLSSRLDPQPNVGIDTLLLGIPTICFEGGAGTAEILAADPATRELVVPHLDAHAAAEVICNLADRRENLAQLRADIVRVAGEAFNMPAYLEKLDHLGREAAQRLRPADVELLVESAAVDPSLLFSPHEEWLAPIDRERAAMLRFALWNGIAAAERDSGKTDRQVRPFRRAHAGFHPVVYALAHRADCLDGRYDPLAHWIRAGRPKGPWSRDVFEPPLFGPLAKGDARRVAGENRIGEAKRIALHGHFHYPELLDDLLRRLGRNTSVPDLFLTTDSSTKAKRLTSGLAGYGAAWRVDVTPNRGRDVGPFLDVLARHILPAGYEIIGHVHAKRSLAVDPDMGERWRNFLWENLVGGSSAMIDTTMAAFEGDEHIGVMFAEDPHIVGWNANRPIAEDLAARIGMTLPLPEFFDFPLGTMFWARAGALAPLVGLKLGYDDYPAEPLPGDGTILHAIERLIPLVGTHAGYSVAGLRVPGTSW